MAHKTRKTKIIATIGPASESSVVLSKLIQAGVDIFRFNLKYSTIKKHSQTIDLIRKSASKQNKSVQILIDLPDFSFSEGINLAVDKKVEYIAISYLKCADEIISFKQKAREVKLSANIVAKIETKGALNYFTEILDETDSVMVARGDLGESIPIEKVPFAQKEIILSCKKADKMVIVATEMLLSMTSDEEPTRAEVSDVANAVLEGADAVMLSEETSIGKNPVQAVEIMSKIIYEAESWQELGHLHIFSDKNEKFIFGA
ncbi:MAG: hypothetical protein KAI71_01840 [Candidatus Pacebacteria bacterium]|nr:hypothetical protein [Candidatus Paceibacterota bacterium]